MNVARQIVTSVGFALLLAIGTTALLVGVGLGPNALPFPPNSPYSDAAISHWPNALFFQRSLQSGYWPLWRAQLMSGQPFAANPLNKVWYPPQWLLLLLPVTLHLNVMIWGHMVLAGVGMRAFGRRIGLTAESASVIGLAYVLTPRLVAAIGAGHLDIVYAMAWFPSLLWAVHNAITGNARPVRRAALLGLAASMCFLADIRLSIFIFAMGAVFGLWIVYQQPQRPQRKSGLLIVLGGLLFFAGMTAVQWLPLAELTPYLSRSGLTMSGAAVFSLQPAQLIGIILPRQPGSHETITYTGLIIIAAAVIGSVSLLRARRRGFLLLWIAMIIFGIFYALGDQGWLWPLLMRILPVLLWLRVPPRIWSVVIIALLVLAGFGMDALGKRFPVRHTWFALILGTVIALELLWTDVTLVQGRPDTQWLNAYAPLAKTLIDAGATKVYSPTYSLPQQVAAYWNIPDFGGVDPFQFTQYVTAFEAATGTKIDGYSVILPPLVGSDPQHYNQDAIPNADLLARWNVSHVLSAYPIDVPGLSLVNTVNDLYLYVNTRRLSVEISWQGPNCFTARAANVGDNPTNVSAWAPGWSLPNDGTVITVQNQPISGCYAPPNTLLAIGISAAALVAAGLALRAGKKYKNQNTEIPRHEETQRKL